MDGMGRPGCAYLIRSLSRRGPRVTSHMTIRIDQGGMERCPSLMGVVPAAQRFASKQPPRTDSRESCNQRRSLHSFFKPICPAIYNSFTGNLLVRIVRGQGVFTTGLALSPSDRARSQTQVAHGPSHLLRKGDVLRTGRGLHTTYQPAVWLARIAGNMPHCKTL